MNNSDLEYKRIYGTEILFGNGKQFGLRIEVHLGRDITEADRYAVRNYTDKIASDLLAITQKLDPDVNTRVTEQKTKLLALFTQPIYVEETFNGYNPNDYYFKQFPWFIVTTTFGRVKLGWRKRVIEISWFESRLKELTAEALFPDENVTKDGCLIHAWSYEKAREYIRKLEHAGSLHPNIDHALLFGDMEGTE